MKKVTYDEACNLVNEVRRGGKENILCIVVADNNCPFCFQLTNTDPLMASRYFTMDWIYCHPTTSGLKFAAYYFSHLEFNFIPVDVHYT